MFQVESDLECVSGPSTLTIGGGDLVDYPLSIRPKRWGVSSGAVAFVAQTTSKTNRYVHMYIHTCMHHCVDYTLLLD